MHTANKNRNLKTQLYSCFAALTLTMCKAGGYFREIRNPFWRLLQLRALGEGPPRKLLCISNSTQIYGNHATGTVICRSRRRAARTGKEACAL